jgi:hypothetical protein
MEIAKFYDILKTTNLKNIRIELKELQIICYF